MRTCGWMPCASSRRSVSISRAWSCSSTSSRGRSSSRWSRCRASPRLAIRATTLCWMPSCRLRSMRRRSSSCAVMSRSARGAELVELLVEAGGQPHVGDRRRGLPGHRARGGRARRRRTPPAGAGRARGSRGARHRGRGPGWPRHPDDVPGDGRHGGHPSPSAPSTLTRTHEASRPRRTPSASRTSTSSSSMACSRRSPSSLSSTRWWSRSPSTARRIARCSHPRRGSNATAAMRREDHRAHGLQPVEKEQRRRRDRDPVEAQ